MLVDQEPASRWLGALAEVGEDHQHACGGRLLDARRQITQHCEQDVVRLQAEEAVFDFQSFRQRLDDAPQVRVDRDREAD